MADQKNAMNKERVKRANELLDYIMEFCDAAQIICSWVDDNGETQPVILGRGNFYARRGMCEEFVEACKEKPDESDWEEIIVATEDDEDWEEDEDEDVED